MSIVPGGARAKQMDTVALGVSCVVKTLFDIHAFDEAVADSICMVNGRVDEQIALKIANDLMDFDDESPGLVLLNAAEARRADQ